jgi:hypothetical protein
MKKLVDIVLDIEGDNLKNSQNKQLLIGSMRLNAYLLLDHLPTVKMITIQRPYPAI